MGLGGALLGPHRAESTHPLDFSLPSCRLRRAESTHPPYSLDCGFLEAEENPQEGFGREHYR